MQSTPQSVLEHLLSQIEMAKTPGAVRAAPRTFADPIAQLEQWIGQSGVDAVMRRGGDLPPDWRDLLARAYDTQLDVLPEMSENTGDPAANLRAWIKAEVDAVGGVSSPPEQVKVVAPKASKAPVMVAASTPENPAPSNAHGELLASLGRRDLPGGVRAEVIAMVLAAMDDPSPVRLREILDRLVHG